LIKKEIINHKSWTVNTPPKITHSMVLSHSCEIDLVNKIKLTSIILAPLRDLNKATEKSKIEELINSNYLTPDTTASFLKYFYINPHEILPYSEGAVVDFSKCFSIRKNSYKILVENKCLQLKEDVANKMALKLSLYFYRENIKTA